MTWFISSSVGKGMVSRSQNIDNSESWDEKESKGV